MTLTTLHSALLASAFEKVLGPPEAGTMAFVRCLMPDVVESLALATDFKPNGWTIRRVADVDDQESRTITADQAVEIRESKSDSIVLLVDTSRAGAGMDGIYSATREIEEAGLFREALRLAARQITKQQGKTAREFADRAVKKARGFGTRFSVSPWQEFDFYVRVVTQKSFPGALLWLLGLWPVRAQDDDAYNVNTLDVSRVFVDRLLGVAMSGQAPSQRIESLRLLDPTERQRVDLERFLHSAAHRPLLTSLKDVAASPHLWINELKLEGSARVIQSIELIPWRTRQGKVAKWSGLIEELDGDPPVLILDPKADATGHYAKLEIRWTTRPENLEKNSAHYQVKIVTDMDEELASHDVPHSARKEEKCHFTDGDFSMLNDDVLINAKIVLSVIGDTAIEVQESDEFVIRFGAKPEKGSGSVGKIMRTLSEGLIELDDRDTVTALASATETPFIDSKGYVVLRTPQRGKSFRVFRPPLINDVEQDWISRGGQIGRWRVKVRASGARASAPEFVAIDPDDSSSGKAWLTLWERATNASRRMADRFGTCGGGVGQIYDQNTRAFDTVVKEYLLSWAAMLDVADPALALANTVEIQSLSGRTIGIIVLPAHPLRVAWHAGYDNLVIHTRYEQGVSPKQLRSEFEVLDGSVFPAFLPGLRPGRTFVFADTLGFHAVGMVSDDDAEPKAAIAILSKALGESESADSAPTVGNQSAHVLGNEIIKYIECHDTSKLLHIHALRPGDGLTVARSLGYVHKRSRRVPADEESDDESQPTAPSFVLELYSSASQRGIAGRFIAEAREKRRSGAGVVLERDQWMLESTSQPGGLTLPRLRWARKDCIDPQSSAHLAVAFDTFETRVATEPSESLSSCRPYFAFGLISFFERDYASLPTPLWRSIVLGSTDGEKHPADRIHTERIVKLQQAVAGCVVRHLQQDSGVAILRTEISPEKAHGLRELHRLCDWVITLDRNAGIEYFDSPRDNKDVYDAYVIDCVPERQDLGCLQLITSTSNLEEIRGLMDAALSRMNLSRSRRNAEFLLANLKALSGRLAIRLTGQTPPTAELIALAMSYSNCLLAADDDTCWMSLRNGFLVPVDDVRDLLPTVIENRSEMGLANSEGEQGPDEVAARPDLIHVTLLPRRGLLFRFAEIKYRRHLRTARNPQALQGIRDQIESLRRRWENWFGSSDACASLRAIRRAKLARVLRFYADKARRHANDELGTGLKSDAYDSLVAEIYRFIERGGDYNFESMEQPDRGWVFCPEYAGSFPLEITPTGWDTRIFMYGPSSDFRSGGAQLATEPVAPARLSDPTEEAASSSYRGRSSIVTSVSVVEPKPSAGIPEAVGPAAAQEHALPASIFADGSSTSEAVVSVCLGTNLHTGADVRWPLTVRGNPHLLVAGLPGMGKTTCLLNLCRQMLELRIRPILFSYHQDIDEKLQDLVGMVRFIDFDGLGFNPLQVIDRSSRMAHLDVAGAMRDIFVAIFPELGDIQGERIRRAIKESFVELGWGDSIPEQLVEPSFSRWVDILRSDPKPDRGLKTLLARLDELEDYGLFRMVSAQESLWDSEHPVVLRIHSTQNEQLQRAFASLVFYGLYKDMFRRGVQDRITHALIFDEAHRAARLQLIPTMAKECRKYGISLVLASQEARDFHTSLFSAVANYLILRLTETDAKAMARNVATSDQERFLADRIKQMDRFRAFYCCEGQQKPVPVALLD